MQIVLQHCKSGKLNFNYPRITTVSQQERTNHVILGGKTRNKAFQPALPLQQFCKTNCTMLVCPFYRSFSTQSYCVLVGSLAVRLPHKILTIPPLCKATKHRQNPGGLASLWQFHVTDEPVQKVFFPILRCGF